MRSPLLVGLSAAITILGAGVGSEAQQGLTKRDAQGPVTVTVTLTSPPEVGAPVKAKVGLDTHSVSLDAIRFEEAVALRTADGTDLAPTAVEEAPGGGHHRSAVLIFPPLPRPGELRIVVKNVGGVPERSFVWALPAR